MLEAHEHYDYTTTQRTKHQHNVTTYVMIGLSSVNLYKCLQRKFPCNNYKYD